VSDEQLTVGAELARARQDAGMTLAQVSDATRVRRTIIEALENDDPGPAGGMAYARGHIRSICAVLGIDPAPLLARLGAPSVAETSPHPAEQPAAAPRREPRSLGGALAETMGGAPRADRRTANWSGVMAGALALVVAVGVFQLVRSSQDTPGPVAGPSTVSSGPPSVSTPPPSPPATTPDPRTSPGDGDAIAQADTVSVELTITGDASWVSATTAKGTLFEGTLTKGERKSFKDRRKIKFVFGNAGNVGLRVNGVDVGAPGAAGQVVRTTFGPGDPDQSQA
jgi:transcriptional regulator with XRE-family HTH domain